MTLADFINILELRGWYEVCPTKNGWHFNKGRLRCDLDWRTKIFTFYRVEKELGAWLPVRPFHKRGPYPL